MPRGVLQQLHPEARAVHVVEPLVEQDHVDGEGPGAVVRLHARGDRGEVRAQHVPEAHLVGIALARRSRGSRA